MGGFPERAKHQHFGLCANRRFLSDRSGGWVMMKKKIHIPWIRTIIASQSLSRYGYGIILTVLCRVIFDQIRCNAMLHVVLLVARE